MTDAGRRLLWGAAILVALPLAALETALLLATASPATALSLLGGAVLGALAADGVTGMVHWACDTWGDAQTRWFGPGLIRAFREHHRDPQAMLAHDWIEVNREAVPAAGAILALLALPAAQRALDGRPLLHAFLVAFALWGGAANQLHLWAHHPRPPGPVPWLQRVGLLLSPGRHARHHRAASTSAYCIANGWLNPLLDGAGFWRALERGVARLTGAYPRGAGSRTG